MASSTTHHFNYDLISLGPNLRSFAMSLCRDQSRADDLVQETMAKAWKSRSMFVQGTNLKAWLFTILRNTYLSDLRKRKSEVEDPDDDFSSRACSEASQEAHMDLVDLARALEGLPSEQREALILVGADGYSYIDAAVMCGCAVGTVKSRVNRARVRLRVSLGIEEPRADGARPD